MSESITLFTWEDAGDAVILKHNLIKAWRPRIRECLQQGTYRIVERPTGKFAEYRWQLSKKKSEVTCHEKIEVVALFSKLADATWFKLTHSFFIGGTLQDNAARLDVDF